MCTLNVLIDLSSNHDNKLGLNRRETFIDHMRRILSKTQLQVPQTLVATPIKELGKHRVIDMSLGPTHSCVVVETGRVYTFGRNSEGQLCTGNLLPKNMPSAIKGLPTKPMVSTFYSCSPSERNSLSWQLHS